MLLVGFLSSIFLMTLCPYTSDQLAWVMSIIGLMLSNGISLIILKYTLDSIPKRIRLNCHLNPYFQVHFLIPSHSFWRISFHFLSSFRDRIFLKRCQGHHHPASQVRSGDVGVAVCLLCYPRRMDVCDWRMSYLLDYGFQFTDDTKVSILPGIFPGDHTASS